MADTMAASRENVARLTDEVWKAATHRAAAERDRLLEVARGDGINEAIEPWDWRHYSERVRQAEFAIDEAELKPYFVLENIQQAAFDTASRLFGLSFVPQPEISGLSPGYARLGGAGRSGACRASSWPTITPAPASAPARG